MMILAIETSCDETAVAVVGARGGFRRPVFHIASNVIASQIAVHRQWGGVVPNLAKREHEKNLPVVLKRALRGAGFSISKLQKSNSKYIQNFKSKISNIKKILEREPELFNGFIKHIAKFAPPDVDAVAVTQGPGLEPALWVGINFAKTLAMLWNKPLVAVNHMEGHLLSPLLQERGEENFQFSITNYQTNPKLKIQNPKVQFPAIALLVSGGHTELVLIKNWTKYKVLGATMDDAAGEAFDKVTKMMRLGYPGGPIIAKLAEKGEAVIPFPRPMIGSRDFNFSFSGLKTAVLYYLQKQQKPLSKKHKANIAASFQRAAVDVLVVKTLRAAKLHQPKTVILGGGVAANDELRKRLAQKLAEQFPNTQFLLPQKSLTGDNAAMIGAAAYFHVIKKAFANPRTLKAQGNLRLSFSS